MIQFDKLSLLINGKSYLYKFQNSKIDNKFLVSGNLNNDDLTLNNEEIKVLFGAIFSVTQLDNIKFKSENEFTFEISKKLKIENLKINSDVLLKDLSLQNQDLTKFFPKSNKEIRFKNHQIQINFQNNKLSIEGSGDISLKKMKKSNIKF